jgi:hypothetical protein
MAARRPTWLLPVRVVAIALFLFQLAVMFAPDSFGALVKLPMLAQFALGLAVLAAVVIEVLAAAGLLSRDAE